MGIEALRNEDLTRQPDAAPPTPASSLQSGSPRPQDVALLLKLVAQPPRAWLGKELAQSLHLSASEISEALARCRFSRLLTTDPHTLTVQRYALLDFLFYGLPYVFAVQPGAPARGLATGASTPPLVQTFGPEPAYVWPGAGGTQWGGE